MSRESACRISVRWFQQLNKSSLDAYTLPTTLCQLSLLLSLRLDWGWAKPIKWFIWFEGFLPTCWGPLVALLLVATLPVTALTPASTKDHANHLIPACKKHRALSPSEHCHIASFPRFNLSSWLQLRKACRTNASKGCPCSKVDFH